MSTIFTNETRDLVASIETHMARDPEHPGADTQQLVDHLMAACRRPDIEAKYFGYSFTFGSMENYPVDSEGYALAFDPLTEEAGMYDAWQRYGVVVGKQVAPAELCANAISRVHDVTRKLSDGACDLTQPETHRALPVDPNGEPIMTRGFFEVYHDDGLAQLRQSIRVYLQHVVLWGRADLWTSYDRYGVKLPGHPESRALPLHVDQNPLQHPEFRTIQGVLALDDCPAERGTFVGVPGSKHHFSEYKIMAPQRGEYVELDMDFPIADDFAAYAQTFPLRKGSLVSWDSRTTHANTTNVSDDTRYIALIAAGPTREYDDIAVAARTDAFTTGIGSNVRDALMHASKKPRYTHPEALARTRQPERLTNLGKLLYGQQRYHD